MTRLTKLSRSINGSIAIVTGAASGMGRATAHLFADEGARVAIMDINGSGESSNTIDFNIGGAPPFILSLASQLPVVSRMVFIDGFSQPGYTPGIPVVVLDGSGVGGYTHGL